MKDKGASSPEQIRISLAAAMSLGLKNGSFYREARLFCLNLLLDYPEGCYASCSYCGLSRGAPEPSHDRSFIRVEWPSYDLEEVIERTASGDALFERVCVSMVMHPRSFADTLSVIERIKRDLDIPISVLVNPSSLGEGGMEDLADAGAEMVSVAVDAASEELFDAHRGSGIGGPHRWERYWHTLDEAAIVFGRDRFGCHLIVGLGETEKQMADAMQRIRDMGGRTHLFSFFPENGSTLEEAEACHPSQFRRIQLARFLIDYDTVSANDFEFDEHQRITGFGIESKALDDLVDSGDPFRTSGCPGRGRHSACNRPFGDGPASDIRSYPFELDSEDLAMVRRQLAIYREPLTESHMNHEINAGE